MSLYGEYDHNNIFAKILRGDAPCYKVYEDDKVFSFLDLFPQARGHTLVIPKHGVARNILEVDPQTLCALMQATQKLARSIVEELQPDGVQIMQFNGGPGGQTVFHIHIHIIPRWPGQPLGIHGQIKGDPAELEVMQKRLSARFASA